MLAGYFQAKEMGKMKVEKIISIDKFDTQEKVIDLTRHLHDYIRQDWEDCLFPSILC